MAQVAGAASAAPSEYLDALERQRLSPGQRKLLALSISGVFLDGYDITIISLGLLQLKSQFHMGSFQTGFVAAAILVGNFVGAVLFGRIADRVGRRSMFIIDVVFFIVFAIVSGLTQNYLQLGVVRFLLGVGIGGDYALASPIIAEAMPTKKRGRLLTLNWGLAWLSGELVSFAVGLLFLATTGADAWRWMLMSGALPAIVVLIARRSMAESPRWLLAQGRDDEAGAAIQRLTSEQGTPADGGAGPGAASVAPARVAAEDADVRTGTLTPATSSATASTSSPGRTEHDVGCWVELFGRFKRNTWFGLLNYVFEGAPFYALSVFLPTILKQAGYSKTDTGIAVGNLLLQLTGLAGIVLIFVLVDRAGRRFVNYLGYAGVCLALVAYVVVYPPSTVVLLLLFAVIEAAVWLGPASTDNLLLGELWPTRIRATGAGVCAGAGRLSAVAGTLLLPVMIGHWGVQEAMIPFLVMAALGVANTVVLGVETKGRSLEALWGT